MDFRNYESDQECSSDSNDQDSGEDDDDLEESDNEDVDSPTEKTPEWYERNTPVVNYLKKFEKEKLKAGKLLKDIQQGNLLFPAPCPEKDFEDHITKNNGSPSPSPFYSKDIFVWEPHSTFPRCVFGCYNCGAKSKVSSSDITKHTFVL